MSETKGYMRHGCIVEGVRLVLRLLDTLCVLMACWRLLYTVPCLVPWCWIPLALMLLTIADLQLWGGLCIATCRGQPRTHEPRDASPSWPFAPSNCTCQLANWDPEWVECTQDSTARSGHGLHEASPLMVRSITHRCVHGSLHRAIWHEAIRMRNQPNLHGVLISNRMLVSAT